AGICLRRTDPGRSGRRVPASGDGWQSAASSADGPSARVGPAAPNPLSRLARADAGWEPGLLGDHRRARQYRRLEGSAGVGFINARGTAPRGRPRHPAWSDFGGPPVLLALLSAHLTGLRG